MRDIKKDDSDIWYRHLPSKRSFKNMQSQKK
jgi:hypothetical protein